MKANAISDEQLIRLYHQHYEPLVRMTYLFLKDHSIAEEIVQEAFIKLKGTRNKPSVGKEAPWLRSVTLNMARSKWRRRRLGRQREQSRFLLNQPQDQPTSGSDRAFVVDQLQKLPMRQKEVILLRYYLDLTEKETAETLKISTGSVKTHARRGLGKLKNSIKEAQ